MRFIYLDEAGTSNIKYDPKLAVAGAIIHGDKQWKPIERRLTEIANDLVRPEHRDGWYFHIKEIKWGSKRIPKGTYSEQEQSEMIRALCSLPREFDIPLIGACIDRQMIANRLPGLSAEHQTLAGIAMAAIACILSAERFMLEAGEHKDEIATLVFEKADKTERIIKTLHKGMRHHKVMSTLLPLQRIPDTPMFAEKHGATLLQVADVCAHVLKRHVCGQDKEGFYQDISPHFVLDPTEIEPTDVDWD